MPGGEPAAVRARAHLGRQLAGLRRERQQTAAEVAQKADLSVHTVRAAEQGRGGLAAFARVAGALEAELVLVPAGDGPARQSNAARPGKTTGDLESELPAGIADTELVQLPAAPPPDLGDLGPITLTDEDDREDT